MNHGHNLIDCVEMILAESQYEAQRDVFIIPAWMMRDLRVASAPFRGPEPTPTGKSGGVAK